MGADFGARLGLGWARAGLICHSMALEQHFPEQQGFLDQLPARKQSLNFVASVNPY